MNEYILGNSMEGQSYSGKSSSLEEIESKLEETGENPIIIPEYSVVGELPKFPRETITDVKKAAAIMLELEKRRTDYYEHQFRGGPVLFDRGPISCLAFEVAAEKHGFKGSSLWLAETFQSAFESKSIIVPNGSILLNAKKDVIDQRESAMIKAGHGKVIDFLRDDSVIKTINEFFMAFGKELPPDLYLVLDTGVRGKEEIAAEAIKFIKEQTSIQNVDFVKFVEDRIKNEKN